MKKMLFFLSILIFTTNVNSSSKFDNDLKKFSKNNGFINIKGKHNFLI